MSTKLRRPAPAAEPTAPATARPHYKAYELEREAVRAEREKLEREVAARTARLALARQIVIQRLEGRQIEKAFSPQRVRGSRDFDDDQMAA